MWGLGLHLLLPLAAILLPGMGAEMSAPIGLQHVGGDYLSAIKHLSGSSPQEYEWGVDENPGTSFGQWMNAILYIDGWFGNTADRVPDVVWLKAKRYASRDMGSYATISQEVAAEPYWGKRISFAAFIKCDGVVGGYKKGFAVLFVRVVSASGTTLAFDNMTGRHIECTPQPRVWSAEDSHNIVIDVPGPAYNTCPADPAQAAAFIDIGFLLCGGQGRAQLIAPTVKVVHYGWEVTGGPPPWREPGIRYL